MAPDRSALWLHAALEEREAGDKAAAVAHLETYLRKAPPDAPERATAEKLLPYLQAPGQAAGPGSGAQPPSEATPQPDVTVRIVTSPPGAQVVIDGQTRGVTPLSLFLAPGRYELALHFAGMRPEVHALAVPANKARFVYEAKVTAPRTRLQVRAWAADGSSLDQLPVEIDRKVAGSTPWQGDVAPGAHQVCVKRKGKPPWVAQVEGRPGETASVGFGEREDEDLGTFVVQRGKPGVFYILARKALRFAWRPAAAMGVANLALKQAADARAVKHDHVRALATAHGERKRAMERDKAPRAAFEALRADQHKQMAAAKQALRSSRAAAIAAYDHAFAGQTADIAPDHWFVRAELCYEQVEDDFHAALDLRARRVEQGESPASKELSPDPQQDFWPCVRMLDAYAQAFPQDAWTTAAGYLAAYEVEKMGDDAEFRKRAGAGMIVPGSPYAAELALRLGEVEFDYGRPDEALPAYRYALQSTAAVKDGENTLLAAYKAAWCAWLLGDDAALLEGLTVLATTEAKAETRQMLLPEIAELAGDVLLQRADLADRLAPLPTAARARVISAAADSAAESGDAARAVTWWDRSVELAQGEPEAAGRAWQAARVAAQAHAPDAAQRLQAWVARYGPGSPWLAAHADQQADHAKRAAEGPALAAAAAAGGPSQPGTWWGMAKHLYGQRLLPAYKSCLLRLAPEDGPADAPVLRAELRWQPMGGKPDVKVTAPEFAKSAARCVQERLAGVAFDPHQAATVRFALRVER